MGGFEFANPVLLWGLPLALLPLLIHLFDRRRARPHPFGAIDFVLRSRKRTARRLRLKRILLFAARTLFLLAVPLALARPQARRASSAAVAPRGPAATAIVLDASLSMTYRLSGRSLFERGREAARGALAGLASEDSVTVMVCAAGAPPPEAPSFDRAKVRHQLDAAAVSYAPADLSRCIAAACRALAESPIAGKRIVLATDLTASAFHLDVPVPTVHTPQGEARPEVVLLDAAEGAEQLPNAAIADLKIEPAPSVGPRAFQLSIGVRNHGPDPIKDYPVVLRVGNDVVAKGFVDVPPRGAAQKALTYRFPRGGTFTGSVSLPPDALAADDTRFFALTVPREVKALIVNGAPSAVKYRDEAFFVEAALSAPGSSVTPVVRDTEGAAKETLSSYDVVALLNVRELPDAMAKGLNAFVAGGGGLFVSLGDQVDADAADSALGPLLPRKLHVVKTAAERGEEGSARKAARFGSVLWEHPALDIFVGNAREGFLGSKTYRYFLLQPGNPSSVKVLASFDDGAPALVEGRVGRGRTLLYTSTVDRDWTDWPIRTSFLPLMQRLFGYLAGTLDEREPRGALVLEPFALDPPAGLEPLAAIGPDGRERELIRSSEGAPEVEGTDLPGIYRVRARAGGEAREAPELAFAVNVDPREGDLQRLDAKELVAYFGERTRTESGKGSDGSQRRTPTWSYLLGMAVALFFFEGLLLRKP